jgi:methionine aminopeptidase
MNSFNKDILIKLGNEHKKILELVKNNINNMKSNKELYKLIDNYLKENSINRAFPIGISINEIIAHDSYHIDNKILFKDGDLIKVDVGLEEDGNIIDSARTFEYKTNTYNKSIDDCRKIVEKVEEFIKDEYKKNKKIVIQDISTEIFNNIIQKGYNALDFLGGHNIEYGKVHGKKLILNKPLSQLPAQCKNFINSNDELGVGEMFAIEVFIPEKKSEGSMIQNTKLLVTHYEVNEKYSMENLSEKEFIVLENIIKITKLLPYEYIIHDNYDKYVIKSLLEKGKIIKHLPLEWIDKSKKKIKYIQYEDCFIIDKDDNIINLSKK